MEFEHEHRLTAVEDRAKSNTQRIEKLEASTEAINKLATSMEVMAERQEQVAESVDELDIKVTALEQKPIKRWDALADKIIWALLAAVIAFFLGRIGL